MPICLIIDHVFPQNLWRLVLFASQCLVYGISFSLDDALHFLCLREIEHTDVIWQDWNICCISALACLISSTCLSTCTLDAVVFRVLFLWCSLYSPLSVCPCPQVKWMMYWIVFALFTTAETATDLLLSWWVRSCSWSGPSCRTSFS